MTEKEVANEKLNGPLFTPFYKSGDSNIYPHKNIIIGFVEV